MKYIASIWLKFYKGEQEKAEVYIQIINASTNKEAGEIAERIRNDLAKQSGATISDVSLRKYAEDKPILVESVWA